MKSRNLFFTVAIVLTIARWGLAHEFEYSVLLTGPNESPANASPGIGTAHVTLDLDLITMRIEAQFSGLLGNVTAANIHATTASPGTGTAIVANQLPSLPGFPTGVTSGVYDQTIDLTTAASYNPAFITASGGTVSDALNALVFGIDAGKAYMNLPTGSFPDGEIRGFLTAVPEPASVGLLAVGGLVLLRLRRRDVGTR